MSNDDETLVRRLPPELQEEHGRWERLRTDLPGVAYRTPDAGTAKTLIVLDGIPGAGKSTTLAWLAPALGAAYRSMARFAEAGGVSAEERLGHQLRTGTPHPLDSAFLDELAALPERFVVLEKFPRSVVEAVATLRAAARHGWRLEVLHLVLPGDAVALSVERQLLRGPRRGRMPEVDHARARAQAHVARASSGRQTLRSNGVPIHRFDMTRPAHENRAAIRAALGLNTAELPWHVEALETLRATADALGVPAWITSGTLYRPFWNGRFGPPQLPTDLDVAVDLEEHVRPLAAALAARAPELRWSVLCPSTRLAERYGIQTGSAAEAKRYATFLHRAGVVRLSSGGPELALADGAEGCLWSGRLELNPALLDRLSDERRADVLARETHHLPRALADYPGLTVGARTSALLAGGEHWRSERRVSVGRRFAAMKEEVLATQRARTPEQPAHARRRLTPEELPVARALLQLHREAVAEPTAAPVPAPCALPQELHGLAQFAREAPDRPFRAWFLEQAHHHRPAGGVDPDVRGLLDGTRLGALLGDCRAELGPLHQGWSLERHLAASVLQLATDDVVSPCPAERAGDWRLCLRMAVLFHDVGKWIGRRPRHHGAIGARLFARTRPAWFPTRLVGLVQWLIRTHDLFGALGRWLSDKRGRDAADYSGDPGEPSSYPSAFDAQAARRLLLDSGLTLEEATALHRAVWTADVGAIAALRWLLPTAKLLEQLVLLRPRLTFDGLERRASAG